MQAIRRDQCRAEMACRSGNDSLCRVGMNISREASAGNSDLGRQRFEAQAREGQCGLYPFAHILFQDPPILADQGGNFPCRDCRQIERVGVGRILYRCTGLDALTLVAAQ